MPYTPAITGKTPKYLPPRPGQPDRSHEKSRASIEYDNTASEIQKIREEIAQYCQTKNLRAGDIHRSKIIVEGMDKYKKAVEAKKERNTPKALIKMREARNLFQGILTRAKIVGLAKPKE